MDVSNVTDLSLINLQRSRSGIESLTSKLADNSNPHADDKRFNKDLQATAKQFEAIFVKMILTEARKSIPESELFEKSVTREHTLDMFDSKMAEYIADKGGLGLGKIVYEKYKRGG